MDAVSDSTGGCPDSLDRYLHARRHGKSERRRTFKHRLRMGAKRYVEEHPGEVPCRTHGLQGLACPYAHATTGDGPSQGEIDRYERDRQDRGRLRQHAEIDLDYFVFCSSLWDQHSHYQQGHHYRSRPRSTWAITNDITEAEDGLALARSRDPLPSDRHRHPQRCPSLERQDAFCDPKTYKGKVHVKPMTHVVAAADDEDAQVAELYRMGLLYDEGEQRQRADAAFGLNDIHHDEPVYSVRPARRGRRANKNKSRGGYDGPLPLNLSFADLGGDNDLAQYLVSASTSEAPGAGDDSIQHSSRHASRQTTAPLRVIYELATSRLSFDVDTSQPPDLMNDSLSDDYDRVSDSELDDDDDDRNMPSQREVHDATPPTSTSGPWVLLGDDS